MKICEKCGNLMLPVRKEEGLYYICRVCKQEKKAEKDNFILKEVVHKEKPRIIKTDENSEMLPKLKKKCESCGNGEAYWWSQQTRSSDEPETRFYRCTKCKKTWREYS
ncbi:MAG: transcription factor S [Candidatus Aenigmarchaeota archaeon]|nr:transcription factor S [Candidatus Aenigmarchaeota archaeon]